MLRARRISDNVADASIRVDVLLAAFMALGYEPRPVRVPPPVAQGRVLTCKRCGEDFACSADPERKHFPLYCLKCARY